MGEVRKRDAGTCRFVRANEGDHDIDIAHRRQIPRERVWPWGPEQNKQVIIRSLTGSEGNPWALTDLSSTTRVFEGHSLRSEQFLGFLCGDIFEIGRAHV